MNDKIKNGFKKIKEEQVKLKREVVEKMTAYVVGAFGLVAGLAWNDAIKTSIEFLFPMNSDTVFAKLIYAVLITILIVFITVYLVKITEKKQA